MENVTLELKPEVVRTMSERAGKAGTDVRTYLTGVIEREATTQTFDDILAPVRHGFAESGLSEDEWTLIFEDELAAVRDEKHRERMAA